MPKNRSPKSPRPGRMYFFSLSASSTAAVTIRTPAQKKPFDAHADQHDAQKAVSVHFGTWVRAGNRVKSLGARDDVDEGDVAFRDAVVDQNLRPQKRDNSSSSLALVISTRQEKNAAAHAPGSRSWRCHQWPTSDRAARPACSRCSGAICCRRAWAAPSPRHAG